MNAKASEKIAGRNDRDNAIVQIVNAVKDGRQFAKVAANPSESNCFTDSGGYQKHR